jgi:ATPase subunit of ABC transporter with duplicated ATPase domains
MTPTALLERLGFSAAHLSTQVKDLSGGQRRRLQLALVLMEEPNVLILDEPSNDLDTDMLAAVEDLLDTWPGTLLVVSHDRYLMERVTDQQYALVDGHLRHVPGGVEEYLALSAASHAAAASATQASADADRARAAAGAASSGEPDAKATRAAKKELAAVERRLDKLRAEVDRVGAELSDADPTDYATVMTLTDQLKELGETIATEEDRWLELGDAAGV